MTAFYMFRLMSMTFFGNYRGPAWQAGGHGAWHGPHESPRPMTYVLVTLAIGAVLAGFVGIPAALGGGNAIEHFLHPSFAPPSLEAHSGGATAGRPSEVGSLEAHSGGATAGRPSEVGSLEAHSGGATAGRPSEVGSLEAHSGAATEGRPAGVAVAPASVPAEHAAGATQTAVGQASVLAEHAGTALSHAGELLLMGFSVLVGLIGIAAAYRFYVRKPEIAERLKARLSAPHRVLYHKYHVDELYDATVIGGTMASANGLWTFDRNVVDGAVNGSGWLTIFSSWFSGILDKYVVDGLVNLVGSVLQESSFVFRRLQTGLIQNYALLMLFGVFAFVSVYLLLVR